jgi:hypothetical protein
MTTIQKMKKLEQLLGIITAPTNQGKTFDAL